MIGCIHHQEDLGLIEAEMQGKHVVSFKSSYFDPDLKDASWSTLVYAFTDGVWKARSFYM